MNTHIYTSYYKLVLTVFGRTVSLLRGVSMAENVPCFASCLYLLPETPTVERKGTTELAKSQRERVATVTVARIKKKGTDPSRLTPQNDRPIDPPASAVAWPPGPHRHATSEPHGGARISARHGRRLRPRESRRVAGVAFGPGPRCRNRISPPPPLPGGLPLRPPDP